MTIPLELRGVVALKDGKQVEVKVLLKDQGELLLMMAPFESRFLTEADFAGADGKKRTGRTPETGSRSKFLWIFP